jgi:uncharacterized protein YoaH (UPF0181 family)
MARHAPAVERIQPLEVHMFVPAVPSTLLADHERAADRAGQLDQLVAAHRAETQRRFDERLAQGFTKSEALAFVARDLRAGRRAIVLREVVRMEVRELL